MVEKFNFGLFLVKMSSRKFFFTFVWVFAALFLLIRNGDHPYILPVSIGSLILTAIYLFGELILDREIKFSKGDMSLDVGDWKPNEEKKGADK
jgi:hypothetical protein